MIFNHVISMVLGNSNVGLGLDPSVDHFGVLTLFRLP